MRALCHGLPLSERPDPALQRNLLHLLDTARRPLQPCNMNPQYSSGAAAERLCAVQRLTWKVDQFVLARLLGLVLGLPDPHAQILGWRRGEAVPEAHAAAGAEPARIALQPAAVRRQGSSGLWCTLQAERPGMPLCVQMPGQSLGAPRCGDPLAAEKPSRKHVWDCLPLDSPQGFPERR